MNWSLLAQSLVNGVTIGATFALIALGITLVYGLSGIINFAVGEMMMFSAFIGWAVYSGTRSYLLAGIATALGGAVIGLVTERAIFQFTFDRPLAGFVSSLGLIIALPALATQFWTSGTELLLPPFGGTVHVGGVVVNDQDIVNFACIVVLLALFQIALSWTRWGKALRATADSRTAASLMGVPVRRLISVTFVVGALLAGVAGWVILTTGSISPEVGDTYVLSGFAVALVGGLGNLRGAIIAGFAFGLVQSLTVSYLQPAWSEIYLLAVVVVVLVVRPSGLLAGGEGARL